MRLDDQEYFDRPNAKSGPEIQMAMMYLGVMGPGKCHFCCFRNCLTSETITVLFAQNGLNVP